MAQAPVNIFSQHRKPQEVLEALRRLLPEAVIPTDDAGGWTYAQGTWKRGWLKGSLQLSVRHDASYYLGEDWDTQLAGMAAYLSRLANARKRPEVFGYLPGLNFAVSFILNPGAVADDPRQEVIHQIARLLDGVIFLPGLLLDADGRVLISAEGEPDPDARLPAHEPKGGLTVKSEDDEAPPQTSEPPAEARVVSRLILMGALVNRGIMEPHLELEFQRQEMVADLRSTEAWREGEPLEIAELELPVGALAEKSAWRLPWQAEGAAVLAWALGLTELPPYDQQVDVDELFGVIGRLEDGTCKPELRPLDELDALSFQMLAIHWRLRQFQVEPKAMDLVDYAPRAWCGPMDLSLARLAGQDLEVQGVPLSEATEETWKTAAGIMEERRMAIHWLLGHAAVYSENDTST
ncbi:MAG: DUF4272 domain-containing protein [Prosthecobacter sp.]